MPLRFMLESQLMRSEQAFKDALLLHNPNDRHRRRHGLEGALGDAWQAYCGFVRHLLIRSSLGCRTELGVIHQPSIVPAKWERASYIALRANNNAIIAVGAMNTVLRKEPTWGDSAKLTSMINALNPGNAANLKSYLAGGLKGPKHCQTVRNACAHKNGQTKAGVVALAPIYLASALKYPIDAMIWREPLTQQFAFLSWLDDMRVIAEGSVR